MMNTYLSKAHRSIHLASCGFVRSAASDIQRGIRTMRFIDFFSGIGGFRIGMQQAGHTCVGHCEIDKHADASYRSMHTITDEQRKYLLTLPKKDRSKEILKDEYLNGEWFANDVTRLRAGDVPTADVYCFGFPCQAFSIAGQRRGFEDTRGTLIFDILRIAKERQPKILFGENVSGLLNHGGGTTFWTIISAMAEVGYSVEWQVLNSKHLGVPQNRERVFIIGHLGSGSTEKVFPIATDYPKADELQGKRGNSIISNTIASGKRDAVGIYPIISGGVLYSKSTAITRNSLAAWQEAEADGYIEND